MESEQMRLVEPEESEAKSSSKAKKLVGYICALLCALSAAASVSCSQALGGLVPAFELNAWRFLVQTVLVCPVLAIRKIPPTVGSKKSAGLLLVGCLSYGLHSIACYDATVYLPVTTVSSIDSAGAVIFTTIFTLVISRTCPIHVSVASVLCVAGVVLVTQPGFIFTDAREIETHPVCYRGNTSCQVIIKYNLTSISNLVQQTSPNSSIRDIEGATTATVAVDLCTQSGTNCTCPLNETGISNPVLGYILSAASVVSFLVYIYVANHLKDVSAFIVAFWSGLVGCVVSVTIMGFAERPTFPSTVTCRMLLFAHSTAAGLFFVLSCIALVYIPPHMYSLVLTMYVLFCLCSQYTVLKEVNPGQGNAVEITGAIAIFLGNVAGPLYTVCFPADEPH